jgi:hypothetical protein
VAWDVEGVLEAVSEGREDLFGWSVPCGDLDARKSPRSSGAI